MSTMYLLEAMTNIDADLIENAKPKEKRSGKTVARVLLLAALIAALTISAFAAEEIANWFKDYFDLRSPTELTPNQITFIEENTTELGQSQTCNGYTITVEAAFSDGRDGIIKLKLTAPEGTNLDARNYFPGNDDCLTPIGEEEFTQWNGGWGIYMDDETPNEASIIYTIRDVIHDRTQWKLRIQDIHGTYEENIGESSYRQWKELIVKGLWEFDVVFSDDGKQEIEVIKEPVAGEVNIALNKDSYKKVTITSIKLRALSAEITYEFLEPTHASGEFDSIFVVMKDGRQVLMRPKSGHPGRCTYEFSVPVILSDTDYVLLPDGTRLPIS